MKIIWMLTSYGLDSGAITGSPIRFHAVSSRWQKSVSELEQVLVTTSGGERVLRSMGCCFPMVQVPCSLLIKREPCKAFRLWSYFVTSIAAHVFPARLPQGDMVITVSDYFCDIVPALVVKRRTSGMRWIAWIHHKERHPSERPGIRLFNEITWRMQEWSFRQIARFAEQAWVLDSDAGDEVATRLKELGMQPERIRKMRNGIDSEPIAQSPDREKKFDAVMIGVRPNKGSLDVVPVWKIVQQLRPGTTLRLMGGMAGEVNLQKHILQEGLDKVIEIFKPEKGWVPFDEYIAKVKEARLLFAPSHEEGWGIALCEAMACGLPVAAYDLPVYRRVYGDALATVKEGDHRGFAEKICALLNDRELFESFQKAGYECALQYGWDELAKQDWKALK